MELGVSNLLLLHRIFPEITFDIRVRNKLVKKPTRTSSSNLATVDEREAFRDLKTRNGESDRDGNFYLLSRRFSPRKARIP